jgi:hypothetical protein
MLQIHAADFPPLLPSVPWEGMIIKMALGSHERGANPASSTCKFYDPGQGGKITQVSVASSIKWSNSEPQDKLRIQ